MYAAWIVLDGSAIGAQRVEVAAHVAENRGDVALATALPEILSRDPQDPTPPSDVLDAMVDRLTHASVSSDVTRPAILKAFPKQYGNSSRRWTRGNPALDQWKSDTDSVGASGTQPSS